MRRLAILVMLAVEFAVCGCANNTPSTTTNTATTGNWEAQLISDTGGQSSLLNFVVGFDVTNSGPLKITGFGFFNEGACFATGVNAENETGSASFTTGSTGKVTGTLDLAVTSSTTGSVLSLTGQLTGTSNGTTTTTGTLTNGVVVGTWDLKPGQSGSSDCTGTGTFVMCQDKASCSTT